MVFSNKKRIEGFKLLLLIFHIKFHSGSPNEKDSPIPQAFVFYVLLCSWMSWTKLDTHEYQVLEFYAGVGRIARGARAMGRKACAVDIDYDIGLHKGSMDSTTDSGFAFLPQN